MEQCDIAIVGAGMVGAATACLLAAEGLSVRVIETRLPEPYAPGQPLDLRVSAISQASVALLTRAGVWQYLQQMRLCPYRRLETWELDGFATRFDAAELGLPQLGYIIENRLVQLALLKRMEDFPTIQTHTPAAVKSLRQSAEEAVLTLDDGTELSARWVLACDGAESHTRQLAGIGVSRFEYRQHWKRERQVHQHRCTDGGVVLDMAAEELHGTRRGENRGAEPAPRVVARQMCAQPKQRVGRDHAGCAGEEGERRFRAPV